jgi:hypothetical protein
MLVRCKFCGKGIFKKNKMAAGIKDQFQPPSWILAKAKLAQQPTSGRGHKKTMDYQEIEPSTFGVAVGYVSQCTI